MSELTPSKYKIVTPEPYCNIIFDCGHRSFHNVKSTIVNIADAEGLEWEDGYLSERRDYEGDLDEIILYRGEREDKLTKAVLNHYAINDVPDNMNIHLSMV